jgi:ABC-type transport system substrate-binding protein
MARRLSSSLIVLAAGAALLLAVGLAHPASNVSPGAAAAARKGGTLRLGLSTDIDVDPAIAYSARAWGLEFATCAKLFNLPDAAGAEGTRVIPEVVDGFTVSKDGKTYTFELKRSFRFHTGAPVTARSFAAAFNWDANPSMESPGSRLLARDRRRERRHRRKDEDDLGYPVAFSKSHLQRRSKSRPPGRNEAKSRSNGTPGLSAVT